MVTEQAHYSVSETTDLPAALYVRDAANRPALLGNEATVVGPNPWHNKMQWLGIAVWLLLMTVSNAWEVSLLHPLAITRLGLFLILLVIMDKYGARSLQWTLGDKGLKIVKGEIVKVKRTPTLWFGGKRYTDFTVTYLFSAPDGTTIRSSFRDRIALADSHLIPSEGAEVRVAYKDAKRYWLL